MSCFFSSRRRHTRYWRDWSSDVCSSDLHEHGHHHHHHHHEEGEAEEYGIGTFVYYRRRPLDLAWFDEFVARKFPQGVIRCKGICWFKDEPQTCYVFEQAGSQMGLRNAGQWYAAMPQPGPQPRRARQEGLRRDGDATCGDRMQELGFRGQNLDRAAMPAAL